MDENINNGKGATTLADEVIATIAGLAAVKVPGFAGMSGGLVGGIVEFLGKKNLSKGVKVEIAGNEVTINLLIIAEYGVEIPAVCDKIKDVVKSDVEKMAGYKVKSVNIHVQGIKVGKDDDKEEKAE
jgi:uncharacterized alkaline shock family protein YloU